MIFIFTTSTISTIMYTMTSNLSLAPPSPTSLTSAVRGHFRYAPGMAIITTITIITIIIIGIIIVVIIIVVIIGIIITTVKGIVFMCQTA